MVHKDVLEENGDAGNGAPVRVCPCVCVHAQEGEDGVGPQGGRPVVDSGLDRGSGARSTPVFPPSRKLACTRDGFHMKQHHVELVYRAPTPDHTHGTVGEPPSARPCWDKAQQRAGPSWEGLRFL